ncbi:MAG: DNA alkylation repair protein [Nanoarchaeota archaeon]|nr:DNA alkylation repair protein [Nanoarchaeota archaeon]
MLKSLILELNSLYSREKSEHSKRFFKTGKGEYGEGDVFLGIPVPKVREVAKKYKNISFPNVEKILDSKIHEHRLIAGIILTNNFKSNPDEVFNFYIKNAKKFNNWDLVDVTAPKIVGNFLINKNRKTLYNFAKSKNLWEKRIAIVSTYSFIKEKDFGDTLKISEILLSDKHDLIHKAVGWMLREVWKKNEKVLEDFIKLNYKNIPRTTLRYAIERFPENKRKKFLKGDFKD